MACDIILTVYNNRILTKNCLESVRAHFRAHDRLFIVDNGSTHDTQEYLRTFVADAKDMDIELIRFDENQGYSRATNHAMAKTHNDFVCLLSNDTVVTDGWLDAVCSAMDSQKTIGIANPMSTTFGLYPAKRQSIEDFAKTLPKTDIPYIETAQCIGFCMVIKRAVIEKIGFLDEIYGRGYFEDTDYCRKAASVGFYSILVNNAYVWHREHSSYRPREIEKLFNRNRRIFYDRWGKPERFICACHNTHAEDDTQDSAHALCLSLARKGNWIWLITHSLPKGALMHAHIKVLIVPKHLISLYTLLLIIKKRKKKITTIYTDATPSSFIFRVIRKALKRSVKEIAHEGKN